MARIVIAATLAALTLTACGQGVASSPREENLSPEPAPSIYRSADKNLTFPTPAGAFYCPKPEGWIGSDHGTVVFLTAPARCGGGTSYASSDRGALDAPNIQVYYGYDVVDEASKPAPEPCEVLGHAAFLGAERPLCITRRGGIVEVRAEAPYRAEGADADIEVDAAFTLVTDADRLQADLVTFREMLRRTSTCTRADMDRPPYPNSRPACAADAVWY